MNKFYLLNPLTHSVETQYDTNGDGVPEAIILPPESITTFEDEVLFNHARQYLIEEILNERNIVHFEHNRDEVRKEVTKDLS